MRSRPNGIRKIYSCSPLRIRLPELKMETIRQWLGIGPSQERKQEKKMRMMEGMVINNVEPDVSDIRGQYNEPSWWLATKFLDESSVFATSSLVSRSSSCDDVKHAKGNIPGKRLVQCQYMHAFVAAAFEAWRDHRFLEIDPCGVWLTIIQGFAQNTNLNADPSAVKEQITIVLDTIFDADWKAAFDAFSAEIAHKIGKEARDLYLAPLSTAGPDERAAFQVAMMDGLKARFSYGAVSICGFPNIKLLGTPEDWQMIRTMAEKLIRTAPDLGWWLDVLLPVLDEFVATSQGNGSVAAWRNFFMFNGESRIRVVTGWITRLFPFIQRGKELLRNPYFDEMPKNIKSSLPVPKEGSRRGVDFAHFPTGVSFAPVEWKDVTGSRPTWNMKFVSGFYGVSQSNTGNRALKAEIGWVVMKDK